MKERDICRGEVFYKREKEKSQAKSSNRKQNWTVDEERTRQTGSCSRPCGDWNKVHPPLPPCLFTDDDVAIGAGGQLLLSIKVT